MSFGLKRAFKKATSNPLAVIGGALGGAGGALTGFGLSKLTGKSPNAPTAPDGSIDFGYLNALALEEEKRRQELGKKQRGQILDFSKEFETSAGDYRNRLAQRLAETGQKTFEQANPFILEDLNARGFATSPSETANAQSRALQEIALKNQDTLTGFDTNIFNELNDIKGTGLSALLGGDQSALDSALELRRAGIQRKFDIADQNQQDAMAQYLAKRQSRDNIIGGLFGLGGSVLGGLAGRG